MTTQALVISLGADGNGWLGPPQGVHVDFTKVTGVTPAGPFPPRDGYWPIPTISKHNENGELVLVASGPAGAQIPVYVDVIEAE
jgi:hypothetical protein